MLTADEKMDAAGRFDLGLVVFALGLQVGRVAVQNVHVFRCNVDVLEEIVPHEVVVALRVVAGQIHVLVHVESLDIFERHSTPAVVLDQLTVHSQRRTTCTHNQLYARINYA